MRNLKKFLALVLAMMMTLSLMVTVNAADGKFTDGVKDEFVEAVDVLNGMKVFRGYEDGSFKPEGLITRAEVAAIVYRLATGDAEDKQAHLYVEGSSKFSDVTADHWAAGYIGYCANLEYILGYGDGSFGPGKNVTGIQALAMILRAVGYGQAGEFKGMGWETNVYGRAFNEGLLTNVYNTTYEGRLSQPATRELIAELLFQAAQIPTVTWTQMGGYNKNDKLLGDGEDNKSLGEKYYGLAEHTGIIVGNQETGEETTLVGKTDKIEYKSNGDAASKTPTGYEYPGTVLDDADVTEGNNDDGEAVVAEALSFSGVTTGLDQYGHKVKIWYNSNNNKAYSFVDLAKSATVYATGEDAAAALNIANATTGIGAAATAAGFKMSKNAATVQWSVEYSAFGTTALETNESPIKMYTVIDNNDDGGIDAIIRLNAEIAMITKTDTTAKPQTISLETKAAGNVGTSKFTNGTAGKLTASGDDNQILPGSTTTLGAVVTAWQVQGGEIAYADAAAAYAATDFVKLEALPETVTGTIASYTVATAGDSSSAVTSVTLATGDTIYRSGILEGSQAIAFCANAAKPAGDDISAGVTYTFTLDSLGRFVSISSPNEFTFLYGTYADFEVGPLGSGTIDYKMYGVDWEGIKANDRDLTWMNVGGTAYGPNEDDTLGDGYVSSNLAVTKKDMSTNSITPGNNTAYMINGKGEMVDTGIKGIQFQHNTADSLQTWTITSADAANGFAKVNNKKTDNADEATGTAYMLTNETVFYVVSGFGTNATVKICTGLKELVGDGTSAVISYAGDAEANGGSEDEVWFLTDETTYDNVDTSKNNTITKVILSDTNLRVYSAQNLYYSAPANEKTDTMLAGAPAHTNQYKLWLNGEEKSYFIADNDDDDGVEGGTNGKFFTLSKVSEINGVPIYKAEEITASTSPKMDRPGNGGLCNVDLTYSYIMVNNYNKAQIGNDIFDVSNAVVADVEFATGDYANPDTPVAKRVEIDSVEKLNNAVSVGMTIKVAIVNNGINATTIYVINDGVTE